MRVLRAGGVATVQDEGWSTGRALGLPRSGAQDLEALALANALVGNAPGAAGVEIAAGGLEVGFDRVTRVALAGAPARAEVGGGPAGGGMTIAMRPGETLRIEAPTGGRFAYLAVAGGIDVPPVLGSRSTYLPTGIGGFKGRRLAPGDLVPLSAAAPGLGPDPGFRWPRAVRSPDPRPLRIMMGPQADRFAPSLLARLERERYTVSSRSDRMGTRLEGPPLIPDVPAALPSEGSCLGAVQVPDNGQPIVILADGPTVGGYPKVAVVASVDFARVAQAAPGATVGFRWIDVAEAQRALHEARATLEHALALIRAGIPEG